MERALRWKTIVLLVLVLLSLSTLAPSVVGDESLPNWFARVFSKKVKLGLDLQGGLHIVYRVDLDKVVDDKAGELKRDIEAKLADQKILAHVETPRPNPAAGVPLGAVFIAGDTDKGEGEIAKVDRKFLDDYEESLVKMDCPADRAGAICLRVAPDFADKQKTSALEQAIRTIKDRVDRSGVADPTIIKKGDDIVVELPPDRLADSLVTAASTVPGVRVESIRPYAGQIDPHRELELLDSLAARPEHPLRVLTDGVTRIFRAGWSLVMDEPAGGHARVLAACGAAPEVASLAAPWWPPTPTRALDPDADWAPADWARLGTELAVAPLGAGALLVGRPALRWLPAELLRLQHLAAIATTVTSS